MQGYVNCVKGRILKIIKIHVRTMYYITNSWIFQPTEVKHVATHFEKITHFEIFFQSALRVYINITYDVEL